MEYVDGPEIKGALPLEQALKLAIELASALEAAHRKSITHRDLKPANILTTKSGIKVLDFGLAKIEQSKAAAASDETVTRALTQEGAIVGTLQYMAPEQLQAKVTDARADIFSFGCVLYEMLTGKRAFDGANTASVIAAVLEREPPSIASTAPASLDWALRRCLAKDPDDRWQTATDLRAALARIELIAEEAKAHRPSRAPLIAWGIAALAAAAAATLLFVHYREKPAENPVSKLLLPPPEKTRFLPDAPAPAVSPDGKEIVFSAVSDDGKDQLWLRPLDSLIAQPLAGTENAVYPFWSPDSKAIAFFSGGKLRKLTLGGGAPETLADAGDARGGSWGRNDVIVFAPGPYAGIMQVSASGGAARLVIPPDARARRFPAFLPDGRHFVFAQSTATTETYLRVAALDSASPGTALPDTVDSFAVYAQGNLLFLRGDTLFARPLDENKLAYTGNATPRAEPVEGGGQVISAAKFSVSGEGLLVYRAAIQERRLTWMDREGKRLDNVGEAGDLRGLSFSPDHRTVAVSARDAGADIWLYDLS